MSFSAEMPFSRASACIASRISRDMFGLLLDKVRTVDVGVRDRDDPGVRGNGHRVVACAHQLPGERPVPLCGLTRANARTPAKEAAVVVGLRERARAARRGHLER